jgi:2,3-bisphosphoglycerate-independent phosphoglycerate mutase
MADNGTESPEHKKAKTDDGDDEWKLQPHRSIKPPTKSSPLLVVVLDGWGEAPDADDNAISLAETPTMDGLKKAAPEHWRTVHAHGTYVGLPTDEDMGNSEVGHNALGAGQIIDQGARLVDKAVQSGDIFKHDGWKRLQPAFEEHTLHFIGLLSDGGVHSRYDQLLLCIQGAAKEGAKKLRVHALTDGRDVEDGTSKEFVERLQKDMQEIMDKHEGCDAQIASGGGRMRVTMDRYESDWDIVERGWKAHVLGEAEHTFKDALEAVTTLRGSKDDPVSDQWLEPFVIVGDDGKPVGAIEDGDSVVIFNFRADRVIELSKAFDEENFDKFDRKRVPKVNFAGMMEYDGELHIPKNYLVPPPHITRTSGQYLVHNGISTFACSESQKIGHVTFFWNGNRGGPFDKNLEKHKEIKSDTGIPFNKKPEMKSKEIAAAGIEALKSGQYHQVRLNFPNGDMVGHTGDLKATIVACTAVDKAVTELLKAVEEVGGRFLITADHGNAETMLQKDKKGVPLKDKEGKPRPLSSHTLVPVPVAIGGPGLPKEAKFRGDLKDAGLTNVTAAIINLLGFQAPEHMQTSLLEE